MKLPIQRMLHHTYLYGEHLAAFFRMFMMIIGLLVKRIQYTDAAMDKREPKLCTKYWNIIVLLSN